MIQGLPLSGRKAVMTLEGRCYGHRWQSFILQRNNRCVSADTWLVIDLLGTSPLRQKVYKERLGKEYIVSYGPAPSTLEIHIHVNLGGFSQRQ